MALTATNIFDGNTHLAGDRATETAHRRIELQSPADLTYLIANVTRAAREKIDRHLPPDAAPEGEDAMRKRVEQLVDEYIRSTFDAAKANVSINGMDAGEIEAELAKATEGEGSLIYMTKYSKYRAMLMLVCCTTEIEAFDAKLAQRIQALSAQIESHTLHLANLRRTAPAETSQQFRESFTKSSEEDDARLQRMAEQQLQNAKSATVDVGEVERMDEVQLTWQNGTERLNALKSGLGGTVAKMERAQAAVDYLEERQ